MRDSYPISIEEALGRMLDLVVPLDPEEVAIPTCLGQVLAEDLLPALDVPPRDCAARDGYAMRAEETMAASREHPVVLKVVGEANAAARATEILPPGAALRVMTGAPLPHGADCVVPVECTCDGKAASLVWWAPTGSASIQLIQESVAELGLCLAGKPM